jgi:3-oxoacyl-[acyl-carrier-protein] synthase-3
MSTNSRKANLACVEYHLPEQILTNEDLQELFQDWSAEKIHLKTGIHTRHIASQSECSSDLGVESARRLLEQSEVRPADVDVLIFCTQTPDYCIPTTACIIQDRLGLNKSCAAFDINRVMIVGFGVGYSWGAALLQWNSE